MISLTIPNSEKWYTNIIKGEFHDGDRIAEAYKKEQFAFFTFTNIKDQSKCIIDSKVRISGDAADHINIEKLVASLDVELLSDNLFGYTDSADHDKIFVIEPNGASRILKSSLFASNEGFLPGSVIVVSKDYNSVSGINFSRAIAPVISSFATSLAALAVLSDR